MIESSQALQQKRYLSSLHNMGMIQEGGCEEGCAGR